MAGLGTLGQVLETMEIFCDGVEYGFATVPLDTIMVDDAVIGSFREKEGLTLIAAKRFLEDKKIPHEGPFAKLSLETPTSLELVGLTAVLSNALAQNNISANVVCAYYHDHIFVQYRLREPAIKILKSRSCK